MTHAAAAEAVGKRHFSRFTVISGFGGSAGACAVMSTAATTISNPAKAGLHMFLFIGPL